MATFAAPANLTEGSPTLPDDETSIAYKLFRHMSPRPVGRNVFIYSDNTVSENEPDGYSTLWRESDRMGDTLVGCPHVTHVFWGGHDPEDVTAAETALLAAAGYTVVRFSDSFNRADNASSMGSTDNAYGGSTVAWSALVGTWGISNNHAYSAAVPTQYTTVIETGVASCTVEVTIVSGVVDGALAWRMTDGINGYIANSVGAFKRVGGGFTAVGSAFTQTFTTGDVMRVVLSGDTHTIYRQAGATGDYVQVATYTDTFNNTATLHGLRMNSIAFFDDFKVTA